jgi:hypothetical protein
MRKGNLGSATLAFAIEGSKENLFEEHGPEAATNNLKDAGRCNHTALFIA